ncbi:hypothetical protein [Paenibacillus koleovorans]|uniref:hypothetical protein n=1 Tax=Paenibacillus koleovorans TaxID=121608 RepID=UPI000FD97C03|nr:hypothetical protein [Paenibacillus koleovorans]
MACTAASFVGLVCGAVDENNFDLVYVSGNNVLEYPSLQYDPIMNGSSTWQIYHGPLYQALVPVPHEEWVKLALHVQPGSIAIYVGESSSPALVIAKPKHRHTNGRQIGVWGTASGYLRHLTVKEAASVEYAVEPALQAPYCGQSVVTEWLVSKQPEYNPVRTAVEANGTLNLNALFTSEQGATVMAACSFELGEEVESPWISFGFSDKLRLWVNGELLYEGSWRWLSPGDINDGRIRPDTVRLPLYWRKGLNTIRAEVTSEEVHFGWGLAMKVGLPGITFSSKNSPERESILVPGCRQSEGAC